MQAPCFLSSQISGVMFDLFSLLQPPASIYWGLMSSEIEPCPWDYAEHPADVIMRTLLNQWIWSQWQQLPSLHVVALNCKLAAQDKAIHVERQLFEDCLCVLQDACPEIDANWLASRWRCHRLNLDNFFVVLVLVKALCHWVGTTIQMQASLRSGIWATTSSTMWKSFCPNSTFHCMVCSVLLTGWSLGFLTPCLPLRSWMFLRAQANLTTSLQGLRVADAKGNHVSTLTCCCRAMIATGPLGAHSAGSVPSAQNFAVPPNELQFLAMHFSS